MALPKRFFITLFLSLQTLLFIASSSSSQTLSFSSSSSSSTICKTTPDPKFCESIFPHSSSQGNVQDYTRFSLTKSLTQSRKFTRAIDKYLKRSNRLLSKSAVTALEDCRYLASLTTDYLVTSFNTVNSSKTVSFSETDDIQTLLSAALTNEQTCRDGLTGQNGVFSLPLVNDTKLFSVSLALFTKGWVPKTKKKKNSWAHTTPFNRFRDGALPLKMTERTRAVYESLSRRKLADEDDDVNNNNTVLVSDIVTVNQNGTGNFTTITEAVTAAPNKTDGTDGYFVIYVTSGVYEENVVIAKSKRYLMIIGDGINRTVVTGNRSVVDGSSTFNSSTFAVSGPNFVAVNMTFRNTAGPEKHQAVALRSSADFSIFYSCSFEAYQDTLYAHSLRQFYRECDIYGTVDFIFGNAAVVFQNCNIYPRKPMANQFNAITAQGRTDPNQNTGISIHNCKIKPADDLVSSEYPVKTYLGRPWKEYSRTVFMESDLDSVVEPVGWREWNGDFALSTLYYGEFNNTGSGSDTTNRVVWPGYHLMNSTDAVNFTVSNFLFGDQWMVQSGVPYMGGLIS